MPQHYSANLILPTLKALRGCDSLLADPILSGLIPKIKDQDFGESKRRLPVEQPKDANRAAVARK
jgi:hypothetical protein